MLLSEVAGREGGVLLVGRPQLADGLLDDFFGVAVELQASDDDVFERNLRLESRATLVVVATACLEQHLGLGVEGDSSDACLPLALRARYLVAVPAVVSLVIWLH